MQNQGRFEPSQLEQNSTQYAPAINNNNRYCTHRDLSEYVCLVWEHLNVFGNDVTVGMEFYSTFPLDAPPWTKAVLVSGGPRGFGIWNGAKRDCPRDAMSW